MGIDFGLAKIGLATSHGVLAEPYEVIRYNNINTLIARLKEIIKRERVGEIVIGVSEGNSAIKARSFGEELKKSSGTKVFYEDETLSTQEAQSLARQAGLPRKKRKGLEDSYAAALILQSYLDRKGIEG